MSASNDQQILLSPEKRFVHYDAFNRGFVQVPRMIAKCMGMTQQAKGVYIYISTFVYEHGRSAFPSLHNIAVGCSIAASSVVRYIEELVVKGFILKVRRGRGKTNDYYLVDADQVNLLKVSEMLWEKCYAMIDAKKGRTWEKVEEALRMLTNRLKDAGLELHDLQVGPDVSSSIERCLEAFMEGVEPEEMAFIPKPKRLTPTAQPSASPSRTAFGKPASNYEDLDEDKWSIPNFVDYFYRQFTGTTGQKPAGSSQMHKGIMSRILKQMDGESKYELRRYIDTFFAMNYDIKTIEWFGTNGRVGEIRNFLDTGRKPFYLEESYKNKSEEKKLEKEAVQDLKGLSLNQLDALLGGGENE